MSDLKRTKKRAKPIDSEIGMLIKRRRKSLGLSQNDVAEKIGISFQQLQKYETGFNRISASTLIDLSSVLSCDIEYFFKKADKLKDAAQMEYSVEDVADYSDLIFHYAKIKDPKLKASVLTFIKSLG